MTTTITILVGAIGSGKTTFIGEMAALNNQVRPNYPEVSNVPMNLPNVHYEEDVLKFLAMKLIKRDMTQMDVDVDEAAQAGLESRGSGLKSTDSRLITLARKANVNLRLASQLMSMFDKRAQWNGDFYILCDSHYVTERNMARMMPDYFSYQVFDANYRPLKTFYIFTEQAEKHIFPLFDTMQVPLRKLLEQEFKLYYWGDGHRGVNEKAFDEDSTAFDEFIGGIQKRQDDERRGLELRRGEDAPTHPAKAARTVSPVDNQSDRGSDAPTE